MVMGLAGQDRLVAAMAEAILAQPLPHRPQTEQDQVAAAVGQATVVWGEMAEMELF
jgi:hypothetical protein